MAVSEMVRAAQGDLVHRIQRVAAVLLQVEFQAVSVQVGWGLDDEAPACFVARLFVLDGADVWRGAGIAGEAPTREGAILVLRDRVIDEANARGRELREAVL